MHCCISGCSNTSKQNKNKSNDVKFYYFPTNSSHHPWLCDKRQKWINAVNKHTRDQSNWLPSKHTTICSAHFIGNAKSENPLHPSYVPRIFPNLNKGNKPKKLIKKKIGVAVPGPSGEREYLYVTGDENLRKRLKATAVPSLFLTPSRKFLSYTSSLQQKNVSCPKNNFLKNNTGPPQSSPKQEENNSELSNALRNRSVRLRNRKAYLLNRRCSVPHCNTRPTNEISLHPCPNNAAVRNEWADALRVSYQYVKNMVACSLHFTKIDFIQSKNSERVLKYNAVPSRNLPNRKKAALPGKHTFLKKDASAKAVEKQQTMTDTVAQTNEATQEEVVRECRACLKKLDDKKSCCNVFQAWAPPWEGMEASIAEDLAKLANVEISPTDRHSKVLCVPCYERLLDAATFASNVRSCDLLLRMRFTAEIDIEKVWPKPIQVDRNINGSVFNTSMDIEIKQEVVSDEEFPVNGTDNPYVETELANLDIKIEPEELVEPPPMNITINGTISLDPLNSENKDVKDGKELHPESQFIEMEVKQEPTSEGEQEMEQPPDLSLECLLCTKSFNSVTGLKAHVIAQHSYKTVKRKADGSASPEKKRCDLHQCKICKRSFQTSTDLMVHETCHNKHACYGCTEKFDSFELLTRHRKRCKASIGNSVQKLKTLEDVKRPLPEEKLEYLRMEIEKIESVVKFKEEDIEMKEAQPLKDEDVEMKDISSEQKDEVSNDSPVASEDDKNKLDGVKEEVDSDKNPESVIAEVEYNEKSESVAGESDSNNKLESVIEDVDTETLLESIKGIVGVENDKGLESIVVTVDNTLQSAIEEVDSDSKKASKEDLGSDEINTENEEKVIESEEKITEESLNKEIEEDPDSNMKLHLEIHSTENETEPALSNADMPLESLENDDCT